MEPVETLNEESETENMLSLNKKPTEQEMKFLDRITRPGVQLEVSIPKPEEYTAKEWHASISTVCLAYRQAEARQQALLPAIGRLLQMAEEMPEVWGGHRSFAEFMSRGITQNYGISRSTAYEAYNAAQRFPWMTVKTYTQIGRLSMRLVMRAIPKGQEGQKWAGKLLEKAAEVPTTELREFAEEKGYLSPGESTGAFIRIPCTSKVAKMWARFLATPEIHAYCASSDPSRILECMLAEVAGEWLARAHEHAADNVPKELPEGSAEDNWEGSPEPPVIEVEATAVA